MSRDSALNEWDNTTYSAFLSVAREDRMLIKPQDRAEDEKGREDVEEEEQKGRIRGVGTKRKDQRSGKKTFLMGFRFPSSSSSSLSSSNSSESGSYDEGFAPANFAQFQLG